MRCIYTMGYYSAVEKGEAMDSAGKWKKLEKTILSKVIQTEKDKHYVLSFSGGSNSESSDVNT